MLAFLFREVMEGNPPERKAGALAPAEAAPAPAATPASVCNADLARRAAKAFAGWARSGFGVVDDAVFTRRLDACRQCPHLVDAPDRLIYRLVAATEAAGKVCALCGCVAVRKARLASETCPGEHPFRPGYNRWGELHAAR
jgi:hypothetical protein